MVFLAPARRTSEVCSSAAALKGHRPPSQTVALSHLLRTLPFFSPCGKFMHFCFGGSKSHRDLSSLPRPVTQLPGPPQPAAAAHPLLSSLQLSTLSAHGTHNLVV